jgi:hypothetical protein
MSVAGAPRIVYVVVVVCIVLLSFYGGILVASSSIQAQPTTTTTIAVSTVFGTLTGTSTVTSTVSTTFVLSTSTSVSTITATQTHFGSSCPLSAVYSTPLNGTLPAQDLSLALASPPSTRLNYSQVLSAMNYTSGSLGNAYASVTGSAAFHSAAQGHVWALQLWGPYVPGYTANMGTNPSLTWVVPPNFKATGVLFAFGLWNRDGTAYGTAYGTYLFGTGGISVVFYTEGPGGCAGA